MRRAMLTAACGAVAAMVATGACGDDPFGSRNWEVSPDTASIFSLARPELGIASGFDFVDGLPVRIEAPGATGRWDVALDTEGGSLVLLPPGALGVDSRARIGILEDTSFAAVREAPGDTAAYSGPDPVPVRMDAVYIVRTHQRPGFGRTCLQYAKFVPLEVDAELGLLRFEWEANPFCNDRALVPPGSD